MLLIMNPLKKNTHPVDTYVGQKLRDIRNIRGVTQERLADYSSITFQQVQKYEKGTNRISASKLYEFAEFFGIEVSYFFTDYSSDYDNKEVIYVDNFYDSETRVASCKACSADLELVKYYSSISDPGVKKKALKILKTLSE